MKKTFEQWKNEANKICEANYGMSLDDLEDCCYMDWYEDGVSPNAAVKRAIKHNDIMM